MLLWRGLPIVLEVSCCSRSFFVLLSRTHGRGDRPSLAVAGTMVRNSHQASFLRRLSAAVMGDRRRNKPTRDAADGSRSAVSSVRCGDGAAAATPADSALRSYDSDFSAVARYALKAAIPVTEKARFIRELADDRQSAVQDRSVRPVRDSGADRHARGLLHRLLDCRGRVSTVDQSDSEPVMKFTDLRHSPILRYVQRTDVQFRPCCPRSGRCECTVDSNAHSCG